MYEKFRRLLAALVQNPVAEGNDFIDCCLAHSISPADAGEMLQEQLGFDGEEFLRILLK